MTITNLSIKITEQNAKFNLLMEILGDRNIKLSKVNEAILGNKANEIGKKTLQYKKRLKNKL